MGVLSQKAVTGMNGIDIAQFRSADDAVNLQITVQTGLFTDTDCLIS